MTFYERYEMLCSEHGMKPQTQEMLDIAGVKSPRYECKSNNHRKPANSHVPL